MIIFHNLYTLAAASKCMQAICNMIFSAFTEENFMEALSAVFRQGKTWWPWHRLWLLPFVLYFGQIRTLCYHLGIVCHGTLRSDAGKTSEIRVVHPSPVLCRSTFWLTRANQCGCLLVFELRWSTTLWARGEKSVQGCRFVVVPRDCWSEEDREFHKVVPGQANWTQGHLEQWLTGSQHEQQSQWHLEGSQGEH